MSTNMADPATALNQSTTPWDKTSRAHPYDTLTSEQLTGTSFDATTEAFEDLTNAAGAHHEDPQAHIHMVSSHPEARSFIYSYFVTTEHVEYLESRFHMGNYVVVDRQTGAKDFEAMSVYVRLGMHLLYYGSWQENLLHTEKIISFLTAQSVKMGLDYDTPESRAHILPFIESFRLNDTLAELVKPNPEDYATFNEFFAREIRADARPVAERRREDVISSPADCRLTAYPTVDLATKYWIKGFGFTLARLLGSEELAHRFDGGSLVIARLAPQDYHRWHAPTSGTVVSVTELPGAYYTVNPQAINQSGVLNVFCENRRSVMLMKSDFNKTPVAMVAVGAMLVGSVKYVNSANIVDTHLRRGQCTGAFYYGGSTVIVVFPKDTVTFDDDIVKASTEQQCETLVRVGERIGVYNT